MSITQNGYIYPGNPHIYQFIAPVSGNYYLELWNPTVALNYTIVSSHQISSEKPPQITPYTITNTIQPLTTKYHSIFNVNKDDVVLITITPDVGQFNSQIMFSNLTGLQSITQNGYIYPGNPHIYQFIAPVSGNYYLELWNPTVTLTYTIVSSHQISTEKPPQITPYAVIGVIQPVTTKYHTIFNVNKNDVVFITISPDPAQFNSQIMFSNLTVYMSITQNGYIYPGNPHIYQFIAPVSGNYYLELWNPTATMTYTIVSSHQISTEPLPISTALQNVESWYWTSNTQARYVATADVDSDGHNETVTAGYYNDGSRDVAQLCVWNGATGALKNVRTWYWVDNTVINSMALGDVDNDGDVEIVTGGSFYDGSRDNAQLCVWNGATLALENVKTWYWTGDTSINSLALGDVDGDGKVEIVTGGYYVAGPKIAQLCIWDGSTLNFENVKTWYWTGDTSINSLALGDVDGDGQG